MRKEKNFYRVKQTTTNFDDEKTRIFEVIFTSKKEAIQCFNYHKKRIIPSNLPYMITEVFKINFDNSEQLFANERIDLSIKSCGSKFRIKRSKRND